MKYRNHGVRHVGRDGAEAHVDIKEGRRVADVPARFEGDGTAGDGPKGAVCRSWHAAACRSSTIRAVGGVVKGKVRTYMDTSIACHTERSRSLLRPVHSFPLVFRFSKDYFLCRLGM